MIGIFFSLFEWFFYLGAIYVVFRIINWTLTKHITYKNKYILITGAANGIGYDTTVALLKKGCNVIGTDIDLKSLREKNFSQKHRLSVILNHDEYDGEWDLHGGEKLDRRQETHSGHNNQEYQESRNDQSNQGVHDGQSHLDGQKSLTVQVITIRDSDEMRDSEEGGYSGELVDQEDREIVPNNHNSQVRKQEKGNSSVASKLAAFREELSKWKREETDEGIFIPVKMDVSSNEDIIRAKERITSLFPENEPFLFGIVNNAGVGLNLGFQQAGLVECVDEELQKITNINFLGVVRTTRQFFSLLNRKDQVDSPCIVNIASIAGYLSLPFFGFYAATKHAVRSFSDSLRREMYFHNCRVACIEPGFTKTAILTLPKPDVNSEWFEEIKFSHITSNNAFKNCQSTEAVVKAILRGLFKDPCPAHQMVETNLFMRCIYLLGIYIIPNKVFDFLSRSGYFFHRRK